MKSRKTKNILIGALLGVLLILGVGYSAFSQSLGANINAATTGTWNVSIVGATNSSKVEGTSGKTTCNTTYDAAKATLTSSLNQPGDYCIYTVTTKNSGNIIAKLTERNLTTSTDNPNVTTTLLTGSYNVDGTTLTNTSALLNSTIASGNTQLFYVLVYYNSSATAVSSATETNTLAFTYSQA